MNTWCTNKEISKISLLRWKWKITVIKQIDNKIVELKNKSAYHKPNTRSLGNHHIRKTCLLYVKYFMKDEGLMKDLGVAMGNWSYYSYYRQYPLFLLLCSASGQWLQPIFRQFVNLIKHCLIQQHSRWSISYHILSEEKKETNQFFNQNRWRNNSKSN